MMVRKRLIESNRNFSPCNVCDVKGDLIGKDHAEKWKKVFEKSLNK